MKEEERPENVVFVIITDGMENASREFNGDDVKKRIKTQYETYKWNFQYLAANQDAFASGDKLGISRDCCVNFETSGIGVAKMCCAVAGFVDKIRKHK